MNNGELKDTVEAGLYHDCTDHAGCDYPYNPDAKPCQSCQVRIALESGEVVVLNTKLQTPKVGEFFPWLVYPDNVMVFVKPESAERGLAAIQGYIADAFGGPRSLIIRIAGTDDSFKPYSCAIGNERFLTRKELFEHKCSAATETLKC